MQRRLRRVEGLIVVEALVAVIIGRKEVVSNVKVGIIIEVITVEVVGRGI